MPVIASLILSLSLLQMTPRQRAPRQNSVPQGADVDAIATFTGKFKSADKKFLTIEVENGQSMRMYITHSTKFLLNDKPAKPSDFHPGDNVKVDASRDARMNLLAVRVEDAKAAPAPESPDK